MDYSIASIKDAILSGLIKCSYCGLCEWVCPTLTVYRHRMYGPRGRVEIIIRSIVNDYLDRDVEESIYTCLLCKACTLQCPAGIDIQYYIREYRSILRTTW